MNEYDSNRMADIVEKDKYLRTENINDIDCYVLNTCHIREKATEKVYHDIGRLKKIYRGRKKPIVLITGCVAQAENKVMIEREPYIDSVVGPQSYHELPKIISEITSKNKKINSTDFDVVKKFDKLNTIKNTNSNISSFITIQEGCDKFCNFCVVPYTRGPEHSRSGKEIINEAKILVSNGVKEITLLGQNVNAYNYNNGQKKIKLSDLIFELQDLKDLKRIRYTTSHPKDMSEDLINCYKHATKLMPLLHLPVQSGSNNVLKNMNRKHTREEYLKIIQNLIKIRPNIKFSSDFIVGYPGETEKDFYETISLIKKVNYINSFSFIYSPRPGTPASKMKMLDQKVQKERLIVLQHLLGEIQKNKNNIEIGKTQKVLVENRLKNQSKFFGRTEDLTPVIFTKGTDKDIGNIIQVDIKKCNQNSLFGEKKIIESEVAA